MSRHPGKTLLLALQVCTLLAVPAARASFLDEHGVRAFIDDVAARQGFNAAELRGLFEGVQRQDEALDAIARPAESLPWSRYRPIFITEARIEQGVDFLHAHRELLDRAEAEYGVPPEVVTAILGVETFYGHHRGDYPVLDTLATLAFEYPPRADFFRGELEQFLLLARNERIDPRRVTGSYAGAMGMPQFISSSYRRYAIDFDGDGQRDLWDSPADVIGSVAAYLARHGWRAGAPVAQRVRPADASYRRLVTEGLEPSVSAAQLERTGLEIDPALADGERVTVIELEGSDGPEVWVGRRNFYVITRYNHSPLYAMAVFQLAERIRAGRTAAES